MSLFHNLIADFGAASNVNATLFTAHEFNYALADNRYTDLEFSTGSAKSFSFWIRPNNLNQTNQKPMCVCNDTVIQWELLMPENDNADGNKLKFTITGVSGGTISIQTQHPILKNRDYFFILTWDGTNNSSGLDLYLNGVKESSPTRTNSGTFGVSVYSDAALRFNLGRGLNQDYFSGYISRISVFNKKLSDSEATSLYNSGTIYNYSTNSVFVSNGIQYIPLAGTFSSIDSSIEITNNGASIQSLLIDPTIERISFRTPAVGASSGYTAFAASFMDGSGNIKTYVRRGTTHTSNGNIYKFVTDPSAFSATAGITQTDDVIDDGTYDLRGGSAAIVDGKVMVFSSRYGPGDVFQDLKRYESTDSLTGTTFGSGNTMANTLSRFNFYGEVVDGFTAGHKLLTQFEHDGAGTWLLSLWKWDGSTWAKSTIVSGDGAGEASIINLESVGFNDTLLVLYRKNGGRIRQTVSTDGGSTWSSPVTTNLANAAASNCAMCLDDNGLLDIVIMDRSDRNLLISKGNNVANILSDPLDYVVPSIIWRSYPNDPRGILGYPTIINLGGQRRFISTSGEFDGQANLFIGIGIVGETSTGVTQIQEEYQDILDEATSLSYTLPSQERQLRENKLIADLKFAGLWNICLCAKVFYTDGDENYSLLDWKNPTNSSKRAVKVGTVTYSSMSGWVSDGSTGYLESGIDLSEITQNDVSYCTKGITDSGLNNPTLFGAGDVSISSGNHVWLNPRNTTGQMRYSVSGSINQTITNTDARNRFIISRHPTLLSGRSWYSINGGTQVSSVEGYNAITTPKKIFLLAFNGSTVANHNTRGIQYFFVFNRYLTSNECKLFDVAIEFFMSVDEQ